MVRTLVSGCGLVALALLTAGCEQAKTRTSQVEAVAKKAAAGAKEAAREAAASAKEAGEAAKTAVLKGIEDGLPKIEEKIKGLSGDAATKAKEKFEAFKKHLEEFKAAAPDKWESLKESLHKEFEDLKKLVAADK
jgi:hypothetical protein